MREKLWLFKYRSMVTGNSLGRTSRFARPPSEMNECKERVSQVVLGGILPSKAQLLTSNLTVGRGQV